MKTIWGVSGYSHDASICVIQNNEIKFASSTERYSRIKNDKNFNIGIINDCLEYGYPDTLVWYENPYKKFVRHALFDRRIYFKDIKKIFSEYYNIDCRVSFCEHHKAHLLSSLLTAPFNTQNTLGVIIDTVGEFLSLSVWDIRDEKNYKIIYKQQYPDSLGLFYSSITDLLGLKPQEDEYILMGMSSYGTTDKYYNIFKTLFFKNNHLKINLHSGCRGLFSEEEIKEQKFNIALGAQLVYEDILKNIVKKFLLQTGYKKIILGGGCALNCRANSMLLELVNDMWVFPNPGDSGAALGAALSINPKKIFFSDMFLGHDVGENKKIDEIIDELLTTGVVGVMNGRAEFGPRALGNRSILADPTLPDIKNMVNNVKGREQFRPFAPSILAGHENEYFFVSNTTCKTDFMQYVFRNKTANLPGTTHIDNTSRLQTVCKSNSFLYKILNRWYSIKGCPALLNTSLNRKGKPLLNSIQDIQEFKNSSLKIIYP